MRADAVVIGAGPNGLVAANVLADAGWEVLVLEEQPEPGGAVKTAELTEPGFHHDVFSAFYPLAAASPAIRSLDLERHGLRWRHRPVLRASPGSGSSPSGASQKSSSAARARRDSSPATRFTPTSRPSRRSAASTAGSSVHSARTSAFRFRRAARAR